MVAGRAPCRPQSSGSALLRRLEAGTASDRSRAQKRVGEQTGRVGVAVGEPHAFGRHSIQVRGDVGRATVRVAGSRATEIRIPKIVREYENKVGSSSRLHDCAATVYFKLMLACFDCIELGDAVLGEGVGFGRAEIDGILPSGLQGRFHFRRLHGSAMALLSFVMIAASVRAGTAAIERIVLLHNPSNRLRSWSARRAAMPAGTAW